MQNAHVIKKAILVKVVKSPNLKNKCRILAAWSKDTLVQSKARYVSGDFMFTPEEFEKQLQWCLNNSFATEAAEIDFKL